MNAALLSLEKIAGFESTDYAFLHGDVVWAGPQACIDHPRNVGKPWQPEALKCDAQSLRNGAHMCLGLMDSFHAKGLLLWLGGQMLPFPLNRATARFDAIRAALSGNDLPAFHAAAKRVLGLGQGLTPSGDDFLGGILFALKHAPRDAWRRELPAVLADLRLSARTATNVISAALLDDMMAGASYRVLHELLAALQGHAKPEIERGAQALLRVGASSGADMLAGVLLALVTTPRTESETRP